MEITYIVNELHGNDLHARAGRCFICGDIMRELLDALFLMLFGNILKLFLGKFIEYSKTPTF